VTPRQLPDRVFAAVGADAALTDRFTLAFDVSDQLVIDALRAVLPQFNPDGTPRGSLGLETVTQHETNLSAGFKAKLFKEIVLTGNFLIRLNENGLRARVVPNVGLSYLFSHLPAPK
jgi:hypothetical protein